MNPLRVPDLAKSDGVTVSGTVKPGNYRKPWMVLAGFATALLGLIAATRLASDGPRMHGKTVRAWVDSIQLTGSWNPGNFAKLREVEAVRSLGSNAAPALVRCFQLRPRRVLFSSRLSKLQEFLAPRFPSVVPLLPNTPPTATELRRITTASAILLLLGPQQGGGVRTVIEAIPTNDLSVCRAAASGVLFASSDAPDLALGVFQALQDPKPAAREFACMTLGYVPGFGTAAIPILTNLIYDTKGNVSLHAVEALRMIGARHKDTIPALLGALTNSGSDLQLRSTILNELYLFPSLPAEVAPTLQKLTIDSNPQVAALARRALSNVSTNTAPPKR